MKAYLNRRYRFSASHRLHNAELSEQENVDRYGKCSNPFGHGHNYTLEISVSGDIDPVTGMICNLGELDTFMNREVVSRYEESNLNMDPAFAGVIPTTEALCKRIFCDVSSGFTQSHLERVRIEETSNNAFEYSGEKSMAPGFR